MCTSTGAVDFGHIDDRTAQDLGIPPGPIRLLRGNEKFGYQHVSRNADRMKKLNGLGFSDFAVFCELVAQSYTRIKAGERGRQIVIHYHLAHGLRLVLQPVTDEVVGFYWSIVTGIPGRKADPEPLYTVTRADRPAPAPPAPRRAILTLTRKA